MRPNESVALVELRQKIALNTPMQTPILRVPMQRFLLESGFPPTVSHATIEASAARGIGRDANGRRRRHSMPCLSRLQWRSQTSIPSIFEVLEKPSYRRDLTSGTRRQDPETWGPSPRVLRRGDRDPEFPGRAPRATPALLLETPQATGRNELMPLLEVEISGKRKCY
jgi:hypothetical protein